MTVTDFSLQDSTSKNCNTLTIIVGHIQFHRDSYIDGILQRLALSDQHLIAAAAHSLLYSTPTGILGEWNNDYFNELWDYALPSSFYEYGDSFEKLVILNEEHIRSYASWLLLQYQNYLFSAFHSHYGFYDEIAKQGGYVFSGTNYSLITFGNHNDEYFDRYCTYTVDALPIRPGDNVKVTNNNGHAPLPYYVTRERY
jgi:hypothetical protein